MFSLQDLPSTPAFIYDERWITRSAALLQPLRPLGLRPLYSIKALPFVPVLELLAPLVDGFSVSSSFEARLAASIGKPYCHLTSPGIRPEDMAGIGEACSHVSFNSLGQFQRLHGLLPATTKLGIRVNPAWSLVEDERYDPCRPHSKLGVAMDDLLPAWSGDALLRRHLDGLHVHNAFGLRDFHAMATTVETLLSGLEPLVSHLRWINLGGGYVFDETTEWSPLAELTHRLVDRGLEVFFEPGNGLVGEAGYLVASVIDHFDSGGKRIAVLDTTINHHPEVFEYQKSPELANGEAAEGPSFVLAGCSCLAGDLFGEYHFAQPLSIGDRIAFRNVGAYSLIKANRFNGHNLPAIYAWDGDSLQCRRAYSFQEYRDQWTAAPCPL
jgi:carboxynorspermidine decarboxylase